jgi:glutamyl/glutaminyl-tRNA synthetase
MTNFLALLGWSPGAGDRELFARDEIARVFELSGITGGNAVFNPEKLDWFNQQYLLRLAPDELARRLKPWFEAAGVWRDEYLGDRHAWFYAVLDLLKPRAKRLDEFVPLGLYFFSDTVEYDNAAISKYLRIAGMHEHLAAVDAAYSQLASFDSVSAETALRSVADARGVKAAALIHAVRVALTGRSASPGLFEMAALLGRDRVLRRLRAAVLLIV